MAKEGHGSGTELPSVNSSRIQYNIEEFNATLDDVEFEIVSLFHIG